MKTFVYVALVLILGSFIYNFLSVNYGKSILSEENLPYLIGIGAGCCALLLCFIYFRFERLKKNLKNR